MAHSCTGEYCGLTDRWDCPNRIGREEYDKRSPEEIKKARKHARLSMETVTRSITESKEWQDLIKCMRDIND